MRLLSAAFGLSALSRAARFTLPLFLAAALLGGCAAPSRVSRIMPGLFELRQAEVFFGKARRSEERADGSIRHEWLLDDTEQVPGQYVTERRIIGTDRDGFPAYYEREVWVPAHLVGSYCRIVIIADTQGRVLRADWEGNNCDGLLLDAPRPAAETKSE